MRAGPVLTTVAAALLAAPVASQEEPARRLFFDATSELNLAFGGGDPHRFNEMIRGDSPFSEIRLRLFLDVAVTPRLSVFNQFLLDPAVEFDFASFLRTYVRYTLFEDGEAEVHLQAGKLPTPFGTFGARSYTDRNPLVGAPLVYHYFTPLRSNQLPADNRDLLAHRGEGWGADFSGFAGGGSAAAFDGLPVVYDSCWDTGVEVVAGYRGIELLAAVTRGTLSTPARTGRDDNDGEQLALRGAWAARPGLVVGSSWARGPYLRRDVADALPPGHAVEDYDQQVAGLDLELSSGHWVIVVEVVDGSWESPYVTDGAGGSADLDVLGGYVEAKVALRPGLYVAGRYGRLEFGDVDDGTGTGREEPWEAPVTRLEAGVGYLVTDRVLTKLVVQETERGAPVPARERFAALQLAVSF